jgi:colanic acid/amylovoran biosynthesis glycosyltransferase
MPDDRYQARSIVVWRSVLLSGSETFIRDQADALRRWRPTYVGAVKMESPLARETDVIVCPGGVRSRIEFLRLRLTGRSRGLEKMLAELRPALVHAHFGGDGWLVSRSTVQSGSPLVITLHGRDVTVQPHASGPRGARYRRNLRTAFDRATLILAVSEAIRHRAIDLGADPAKVRVHHTGVPVPPASAPVPRKWDVIFVGRFVAKKGVDDLIEAIGTMPAPRPRVLLVGTGPLEASLRARATDLGLDATFLGAQPPAVVRRCLTESALFVSPSKTAPDGDAEGLPTTILEAAAQGLAAVSTWHSGIPEAVVDGETGLLCNEGDRPALAEHIGRLLADDDLRVRLGRQARRHIAAHFDVRIQADILEDLYDSVIDRTMARG